MSDADPNAEAVWEAIGGDPDDLVDTDDTDTVEVPAEQFESLVEMAARIPQIESRLRRLEEDRDSEHGLRDSMATIQKYAKMVEDGVGDSLGVTDRRAVAIYHNWDSIKRRLGNSQYGVTTRRDSTKKNQPNQFKIDLENILDEDLEWEQIYRAMKAVAELSGGELEQTQYGRTKIVGGLIEYHERTSPDNTDHTVYKVLVEQ